MKYLLTTLIIVLLCSCTTQNEQNGKNEQSVKEGYADLVLANYQDTLETAKKIKISPIHFY